MIKLLLKYNLTAAVLWTVTIFVLCCTPGKYVPTNNWLELLNFDKLVHASMFFILVFLWLMYFNKTHKLNLLFTLLIVLLSISYGGLLEVMQATLFSQRSGDWLDFIANSFGCLIALWVFNKYNYKLISAS